MIMAEEVIQEDYTVEPMSFGHEFIDNWLKRMMARVQSCPVQKQEPKKESPVALVISELITRGFYPSILKKCSEFLLVPEVRERHRAARDFIKNHEHPVCIWFSQQAGPKEYLSHDIAIRYTIKTSNVARFVSGIDAVNVVRYGTYGIGAKYVTSAMLETCQLLFISNVDSVGRNSIGAVEQLVYTRLVNNRKTVVMCNSVDVDGIIADTGEKLLAWANGNVFKIEKQENL